MGQFTFDMRNPYISLGTENLLAILDTSIDQGINTIDEDNLNRRREIYGRNAERKRSEGFLSHACAGFKSKIITALTIFAFASIIIESIEYSATGWVEGVTIGMIILVLCLISSFRSYSKTQSLQAISAFSSRMKSLSVKRNSERQTIFAHELLVGDIAFIEIGEEIQCDGLLVKGEVYMNESIYTGEAMPSKKTAMSLSDNDPNKNPLIYGGSHCTKGQGLMVVTAVGDMKQSSKIEMTLATNKDEGYLSQTLENFILKNTLPLKKYWAALTFLILLVYIIHFIIRICTWKGFSSIEAPLYIIRSLLSFSSIVILAIPDGIGFIVTLEFAYTMHNLLKENCLVRKINALEYLFTADEFFFEKSLLTEDKMIVSLYYFNDSIYDARRVNPNDIGSKNLEMLAELLCIIIEHGGMNSELGLAEFAKTLGRDYKINTPSQKVVRIISPNSNTKRRLLIYKKTDSLYKIIVFGAFDQLLKNFTQYHSWNDIQSLNNDKREELTKTMDNLAMQALRTFALGYRDVVISNPSDSPENWTEEELDKELTLFALLGIKNLIKSSSPDIIEKFNKMGINLRMFTGDSILHSKVIALECGVLPRKSSANSTEGVMDDKELTAKLKDPIKNIDSISKVKIFFGTTPENKFTLVKTLKSIGKTVVVLSESTHDAPAIKEADVGFSCGISGTEIVREASDIIVLDDNLLSVLKAVLLGRNLKDLNKRMIFFFVSGSLALINVCLIGIIINGESPFYSVQILWISFILVLLPYFTLVSEPVNQKLLEGAPFKLGEALIDSSVRKQTIFQSLSQTVALVVLLIITPYILNIPSSPNNYPWKSSLAEQYTMVFNSFVFLQLLNVLNARNLKEKNPFFKILQNKRLLLSNFALLVIHVLIVQFAGIVSRTSPLSPVEYGICVLVGFLGFISGFIGKVIFRDRPSNDDDKPQEKY